MNKVQAMITALTLIDIAVINYDDGDNVIDEAYGERNGDDIREQMEIVLSELRRRRCWLEQATGRQFKGGR